MPMGMGMPMGGMKGFSKGKGWTPPQTTTTAYIDRELKEADAEGFSGATLIPYRRNSDGGLEVLLSWEKPWNVLRNAYDELCWHTLGGKRIMKQEPMVDMTAIRCFHEAADAFEGVDLPNLDEMVKLMGEAFAIWYPTGRNAFLIFEVKDGVFDNLPQKFAEAKENAGPQGEFKITPAGIKKWTKQIEALEWVAATDLVPEAKKGVSDLLKNILQIGGFREFLEGSLDPAKAYPQGDATERVAKILGAAEGNMPGNGKGKSKGGKDYKGGKDFKGGKSSKGKSGKGKEYYQADRYYQADPMMGFKGMYGGKGGMPMFPHGGMPMPPMAPPAPFKVPTVESEGLTMQLYGEQLFVLIQPMVPNQYVAQKITGMLLELPSNELMLNLSNQPELRKRVEEALVLLKEDGVV